MSQWTHVTGIIRIDSMRVKHKSLLKRSLLEFEKNIPEGSEGPLSLSTEYTGYEEGNSSSINIGNIIISGDLRDYDDHMEIFNWVKGSLKVLKGKGIFVRSIAVGIEVKNKSNYLILQDKEGVRVIHLFLEDQSLMKKIK